MCFFFIEFNLIESRKSKINNVNNMTGQVSKFVLLLDSTGLVNPLDKKRFYKADIMKRKIALLVYLCCVFVLVVMSLL